MVVAYYPPLNFQKLFSSTQYQVLSPRAASTPSLRNALAFGEVKSYVLNSLQVSPLNKRGDFFMGVAIAVGVIKVSSLFLNEK